MTKFGFWALLAAAVTGYFAYKEGEIVFRSTTKPMEISLEKLIARGPTGNAHVVVTDFSLCDNRVHVANKYKGEVWTKMCIPIVPNSEVKKGQSLSPTNFEALIFSISILPASNDGRTFSTANVRDLEARLNKPKVQGLITNTIDSLSSEIRDLLKRSYPQTDFDKCLIIEEGREPTSQGLVIGVGAVAVLTFLLGITLLLLGWRSSAGPSPQG